MSAPRRWLRRSLLALIALVVAGAVAWFAGRERAAEWLARQAESALGEALHLPVRLEAPRLGLWPPGVALAAAVFGEGGEAARLATLSLRLRVGESLRAGRPAVSVAASDLFVDVARFAAASDAGESPGAAPRLPPFALTLVFDGVAVRFADQQTLALRALDGAVTGGPIQGLSFAVRGAAGALENGERRLRLDGIEVAARWRDGLWLVERGEVRGPDIALAVSGQSDPLRHHVELKGDLQGLSAVLPEEWRAAGALTARLDLVGNLTDLQGDASLRIDDAVLAGIRARRVEGSAQRTQGRVTVPSLRVDLGEGSVAVQGELGEAERLPLRAVVTASGLDLTVFAPLVGRMERAAAHLDGSVEIDGSLRPLSATLQGQGTLLPRGGAALAWTVAFDGSGAAQALRLSARRDGGGELVADVKSAPGGALGGTLRADLVDVAPLSEWLAGLAPAAVLPSGGSARIDATLSGTLQRPLVEAAVSGRDLALRGSSVESLEALLRADASTLDLERADLRLARGAVEASGRFALNDDSDNDWRAQGTGIESEWLLALLAEVDVLPAIPVRGRATATVRATGPWPSVAIDGTAAIDDGAAAGQPLRRLRANFTTGEQRWNVDAQAEGDGTAHLQARVRGADDRIELSLAGDAWDLGKLALLDGYGLSGVAAFNAAFAGVPGALSGAGSVRVDALAAGDTPLGALDVRLTAREGAWDLDGKALGDSVRMHATVDAAAALPVRCDATWRDVDVARLLGGPSDVSAVLSGSMSASGSLRNPDEIAGRIELTQVRLAHGGESLEASAPIGLRLRRGGLEIQPFDFAGAHTKVHGRGQLAADGNLDVALSGAGSLSWLEALLGPPLESADGEVGFDLAVRRPPAGSLALSGEVRVGAGALDFGDAAALSDIEAVFALDGGVVTVKTLTAELGGGRLTMRGAVDLSAGPDLEWRLRDVALEPARSLEVEVSGTGRLRGAWNAVLLSGELDVLQLLYDRDLEFSDLIPSFNRALRRAPKSDERRPPLRLDLRVKAVDSLYVENNIARLEGGADLRVGGTLRAPKLKGEIGVVDGVIRLRGREFDVVNGSLSFRPALGNVAAIDFRAESVIDTRDESYGVTVRVSGFTNDYRVSLTSTDGSLSPTDVASLITFGKTVAQLQSGDGSGGGPGVSLDTLVNLAGDNLGGRLTERAEEVLPFDEIEFRTQFSTTTGQFEPEVRVGRSLSEDLSAWIGQTFGVQSRTSVEAEYRLSARIATALLWESSTASEQGALGGEIRFRREFWRVGQLLFFGLGD